jgi:hypothetical protein
MNRLAVVLAADSASTVTQWTSKGPEERYFKGANKIFQLSDHHPVGLMIFDAADLMRVPWEVVVKAFRTELNSKSFNKLSEYAEEFFRFIEVNQLLFPPEVQKSVLLDEARKAAIAITVEKTDDEKLEPDARKARNDARLAARSEELQSQPFAPGITADLFNNALPTLRGELVALLAEWNDTFGDDYPSNMNAFADAGITEVLKHTIDHLPRTGLVVAGFGDHDIFPAFVSYRSCGVLLGKHVVYPGEEDNVAITHDLPAWLASFAQTEMSNTFTHGVSEGVYISIVMALNDGLKDFAKSIADASGGNFAAVSNIDEVVKNTRDAMGKSILAKARREHALPLRRVLSVLPVDEMAELAETLINLQSLKEKVTRNSESVGGPVDVAVITKNEGLVWIKRKHYFDPSLNSRYMARQQARLV